MSQLDAFKSFEDLKAFTENLLKRSVQDERTIKTLENNLEVMKKTVQDLTEKAEQQVEGKIPAETLVCHMEIEKLLNTSLQRQLDLNETKQLDLLIKNLYIVQGKTKPKKKDKPQDPVDEAKLLLLAGGKGDE